MKKLIVIVVGILAAGSFLWWLFSGDDSEVVQNGSELRIGGQRGESSKAQRIANQVNARKSGKVVQRADGFEQHRGEKPDFLSEVGEDAKLTEEMKRIYLDLQAALDMEDKARVFALVHKLQAMDEWPDDIPRSVKLKALDALAWFGHSGMAEAVGFLADSDPEVVQTSVEKFEEMLSDMDAGDRAISEILQQIVKVVHDRDALDSFYMEMNNMRDTVRAETALAIFESNNSDAIAVLKENLDFYFTDIDKEQITREDVEKFLADAEQAYKDDPEKAKDDEEFYGPPKD